MHRITFCLNINQNCKKLLLNSVASCSHICIDILRWRSLKYKWIRLAPSARYDELSEGEEEWKDQALNEKDVDCLFRPEVL